MLFAAHKYSRALTASQNGFCGPPPLKRSANTMPQPSHVAAVHRVGSTCQVQRVAIGYGVVRLLLP